jgi:hypothetical protein
LLMSAKKEAYVERTLSIVRPFLSFAEQAAV